PLSSAEQSEISTLMRDFATEAHNSAGYIETPRAHDYIDQRFSDVIDLDDESLLEHLSADGLERFVREEGPHAAFERQARRLESRIEDLPPPGERDFTGEVHAILEEIRRLETSVDPDHSIEETLTLRDLYQSLS